MGREGMGVGFRLSSALSARRGVDDGLERQRQPHRVRFGHQVPAVLSGVLELLARLTVPVGEDRLGAMHASCGRLVRVAHDLGERGKGFLRVLLRQRAELARHAVGQTFGPALAGIPAGLVRLCHRENHLF
jgi:hypothetical protein